MNRKTNIGVIGVAGRMGIEIVKAILSNNNCKLVSGLEHKDNKNLGLDIGLLLGGKELGISITDDKELFYDTPDVVIDFSTSNSITDNIESSIKKNIALVFGTTGFSMEKQKQISEASELIPILYSPNMSIGANATISLVKTLSSILGNNYEVEIYDHHHKYKKDIPSGTAIALGKAVSEGIKMKLKNIIRSGSIKSDSSRGLNEIGYAATRAGNSPGEHTVMFLSDSDSIEIKHKAFDRSIFAEGAVEVAVWLNNKKPGLYSMSDYLAKS